MIEPLTRKGIRNSFLFLTFFHTFIHGAVWERCSVAPLRGEKEALLASHRLRGSPHLSSIKLYWYSLCTRCKWNTTINVHMDTTAVWTTMDTRFGPKKRGPSKLNTYQARNGNKYKQRPERCTPQRIGRNTVVALVIPDRWHCSFFNYSSPTPRKRVTKSRDDWFGCNSCKRLVLQHALPSPGDLDAIYVTTTYISRRQVSKLGFHHGQPNLRELSDVNGYGLSLIHTVDRHNQSTPIHRRSQLTQPTTPKESKSLTNIDQETKSIQHILLYSREKHTRCTLSTQKTESIRKINRSKQEERIRTHKSMELKISKHKEQL